MQILKYKYSNADTNIDADIVADIVTEMQIQTLTLDRKRYRDAEIDLVTYADADIANMCTEI